MSETVKNAEEVPSIIEGMVNETKIADSKEIAFDSEKLNSLDDSASEKPKTSTDSQSTEIDSDKRIVPTLTLGENGSILESSDCGIVDKSEITSASNENIAEVNSIVQSNTLQKRGPSDPESSDDGSEYKDAVNPTTSEDQGSEIESDDSGNSDNDGEEPKKNHRNTHTGSKESESDEESEGRSDCNESEPSGTRESGDGEEKIKDKPLDRDEDKKDPQYIPKKGMFYEHDDRTFDGTPPPEKDESKDKKKKFVADKVDRWGHDMFDVQKQSPKTAQDLIDFYGYDIRNEEEAPKAWRSRRYGRGPNKYTRKWQDEAAYHGKRGPPVVVKPKPFKKQDEDFPTMEESRSFPSRGRGRGRTNLQQVQNQNLEREQVSDKFFGPPRERSEPNKVKAGLPEPAFNSHSYERNTPLEKPSIPKEQKSKEIIIEKSNFPAKKKAFSNKPKLESNAEADIAALSKKFSNAVINIGLDGKILPIGGSSQVKEIGVEELKGRTEDAIVVEAVQEVQPIRELVKEKQSKHEGKSKRYSSQRQRSLPQPGPIQQQPQQQQQFMHQQNFSFEGEAPPIYHNAPPPGVYPEGLVFLPPGYQPPAPPPPHLINYSLPPPPQQYGLPMPAPPDLFPSQPGITYYSPTQQPPPPRPNTSRKGKFAIPIIAPDQVTHES